MHAMFQPSFSIFHKYFMRTLKKSAKILNSQYFLEKDKNESKQKTEQLKTSVKPYPIPLIPQTGKPNLPNTNK